MGTLAKAFLGGQGFRNALEHDVYARDFASTVSDRLRETIDMAVGGIEEHKELHGWFLSSVECIPMSHFSKQTAAPSSAVSTCLSLRCSNVFRSLPLYGLTL
jgi:hypothetical protein